MADSNGGSLQVTDDGGETWTAVDIEGGRIEDFVLVDDLNGWLSVGICASAVCHGELWQTSDGGSTWDVEVLDEDWTGTFVFVDKDTGWLRPLGVGFSGPAPTVDGRTLLYKID